MIAFYRWKYAGNCILDLHIKRYTQMWSWNHIKSHRQLLKSYKNVYKVKLTQTKLSEENQKQIQVIDPRLEGLTPAGQSLSRKRRRRRRVGGRS